MKTLFFVERPFNMQCGWHEDEGQVIVLETDGELVWLEAVEDGEFDSILV